MIKMGRFEKAEETLQEAKEMITRVGANKYLVSIERNLALAKSKISDFGHYYKFILEHEPKLIEGTISRSIRWLKPISTTSARCPIPRSCVG